MKVLLTGHLGYIGPAMIESLKQNGHYVTGLDIGYFRSCVPQSAHLVQPDREIVRDIRDVETGDMEGHDAIIHLAAISNDPMGAFAPEVTLDINFVASVKLATLAKSCGVSRFVFASSCSIYGAAGAASDALDETAAFNPVSAYAVSKVKTEAALRSLADSRFCPVYMRNATAYGLAPRVRFDLVFNNLIASAYRRGLIEVTSDGTPWRPLVHVRDIAAAAVAALEAPWDQVWNQAFNVGRQDANYQIRDIAAVVKRFVPSASVTITGETGGDPRSYRVDFGKVSSGLTGFDPQWALERSADEFVEWFARNGDAGHDAFSAKFIRLKHLNNLVSSGILDDQLRVKTALALAS